MSDHHDAQDYTANGPTNAGFRTGGDGTGITDGVVASGIRYGVHGIGLGTNNTTAETVGVFGESRDVGVRGQSDLGTGVGGTTRSGYGVTGFSRDGTGVQGSGPVGVRGIARGGVINDESESQHIGVLGESEAGPGVLGDSERGVGVEGHGNWHAGVHGRSDGTYGGVFEGHLAPLLLKPSKTHVGPPGGTHEAGELFVDRLGALFYCAGGSPPQWEQLAAQQRSWVSDFIYRIKSLWSGGG